MPVLKSSYDASSVLLYIALGELYSAHQEKDLEVTTEFTKTMFNTLEVTRYPVFS